MEAYLDYNASTPLDPRVFDTMIPYFRESFGNASSIHKAGQKARHAIETAREEIADCLGVEPGDIIFTSGGTEADNIAFKGSVEAADPKRRHLVVSTIEHSAVLHPARYLASKGYKVTFVSVGADGLVDPAEVKNAVTDETALVSVMHVNNEVGTVQPIREIAAIAKKHGALFHTDAVQSFGKLLLDPEVDGIDLLSMSAHKICGPKGCGAVYIRKGVKVKSVTHGGHQEKNIRPGTENVAAIAGFGRAARFALQERAAETKRVHALREKLFQGLQDSVPDIRLNGHPDRRIYNTLSLSFAGLEGETLLMNLDLKGIFVSTGSACTAGSVEPSHVLIAMGLPDRLARSTVRISLGRFTTSKEIDHAILEIPPIVERLRKASTSHKPYPPHPKEP